MFLNGTMAEKMSPRKQGGNNEKVNDYDNNWYFNDS